MTIAATATPVRMGFFTDTSICIGCKACEVACKEWNLVPDGQRSLSGHSYDNTLRLDADNWRHVAFIEQTRRIGVPNGDGRADGPGAQAGEPAARTGEPGAPAGQPEVRWLMSSDVCKHCTEAGCLDVCPTGALFRTKFGTVVVQEDICNGCGYCVPACPFGVIDKREDDGRVWKCTLCYDRLRGDMEPACAQACPTKSIQFGPLDELRAHAATRVQDLRARGVQDARLYGDDPEDGVGGTAAFFLLLDEPQVYGLPPDPVVPTRAAAGRWARAALASLALVAATASAVIAGRR
jgi:formate dehydrogenase iron-sulfur subunit